MRRDEGEWEIRCDVYKNCWIWWMKRRHERERHNRTDTNDVTDSNEGRDTKKMRWERKTEARSCKDFSSVRTKGREWDEECVMLSTFSLFPLLSSLSFFDTRAQTPIDGTWLEISTTRRGSLFFLELTIDVTEQNNKLAREREQKDWPTISK
jgi:hypothetical protein